jgi:glycosyltransferase involved in cell wall biosynthesis
MNVRLLIVGASSAQICGVRDYARVTEDALRAEGASTRFLWWERDAAWSPREAVARAKRWLDEVDRAVEEERPDWIVWHYSVFTWGFGGIPVLARLIARRLARTGVPVLGVLHEFAFPFGAGGTRGTAWAVAQRLALRPVIRACARVTVTTEERAEWLRARRWLPQRPVSFLPVCSNLPAVSSADAPAENLRVGVFGFADDRESADTVVGALAQLGDRGLRAQLVLVGAPGRESAAATTWRNAAAHEGGEPVSFTGVLSPTELARELAALDLVVFVDGSGPSSRKTTLAACLALGRPVVAVDGPGRWERLVESGAVVVAPRSPEQLAAALEPLLQQAEGREAQGRRGERFYREWMAPEVLSRATLRFLAGSYSEAQAI